MPGRIVCNASPLIFLSKLDKLNLLDTFIQKGYRIKEEIIVDFLRKLKTEHKK